MFCSFFFSVWSKPPEGALHRDTALRESLFLGEFGATPAIALTAVERDIEAIEVTAGLPQIEDGSCSPPCHFLAEAG